ncbi:winged helix-turn-helix domain-containing protein [Aeromonas veronii]|uniref:winged helix-turn-helix domain-containing protein n=1 Tax=Aeromonas veronii TaxID=654 RepID=UPI001F31E5E4|nr:winged helix-turn-helix domain-containing protein [Aeromonas veronii]MCF5857735.1 winged helix-turn-helix domain-containing protein [Aeromonas veronii]
MMRNYVLGNQIVFDVLKREVVSPTQTIMLGGREAAILKLLCMHSNEVISKEQIHQQVWGKVLVSETSLTKAISNLRKSLVRIESLSCEIKTIPKEGYMLICESSSVLELSTEMVPTFNVKQINNVNASIELTRRISSQDSNNIESVSHITHTLISIRRGFMLLLASSLLASFISGSVFFLIK